MATRNNFLPGRYYHVYNRGTDKRKIFEDAADWERFVRGLAAANGTKPVASKNLREKSVEWLVANRGEPLVDLCAYCLMPNHFHLVIRVTTAAGASTFLQKLLTSHSGYFNRKYDRSGTLFQNRTRSKLAANQAQLLATIAYVHRNPLKILDPRPDVGDLVETENALARYRYSSCYDYDAARPPRPERLLLNLEVGPRDGRGPTSEWG